MEDDSMQVWQVSREERYVHGKERTNLQGVQVDSRREYDVPGGDLLEIALDNTGVT